VTKLLRQFVCARSLWAVPLFAAFSACTPFSKDQNDEHRRSAQMIVKMDKAVKDGDLRSYCDALMDNTDYAAFIKDGCRRAAEKQGKGAEGCTDAKIKEEVQAEIRKCLATNDDEFGRLRSGWPERYELMTRKLASETADSQKLLQEERAKLR
jgi:hypothetical protein